MSLKRGLLLLGVLVALICIPATVCAAGDGCGEPYITIKLEEPDNYTYRNLVVEKIEILDPLSDTTPVVNLLSKDYADSKYLCPPTIGKIVRKFDRDEGTYKHDGESAHVCITPNEKESHSLPGVYQNYLVYTEQTFPDFEVAGPEGVGCGNVLMLKYPEEGLDRSISFTELFKGSFKEGYLFSEEHILYFSSSTKTDAAIWPSDDIEMHYDRTDLAFTLDANKVDLKYFCPKLSPVKAFSPNDDRLDDYCKPKPGEYLLTAVKYDSDSKTMRIFAAMPVLILKEDTEVTWSGGSPYYLGSENGVTVRFDDVDVDKIAYALVKKDPCYDLDVDVDTKGLAEQGKGISNLDGLIPILNSITQSDGPVTYTLKPCGGEEADLKRSSGLVIAEGYGCAGYANADCVKIAAATLNTLTPGTYYLYALGTKGQKVVAVDQTCIGIGKYQDIDTAEDGTVIKDVEVDATSEEGVVATLRIPKGVKALDENGNQLKGISIGAIPADQLTSPGKAIIVSGCAFDLQPDGATFDPAITLTFDISQDVWNRLNLDKNNLEVKWYNKDTGKWEDIPTTVDKTKKEVSAKITHFSTFALFEVPKPTKPPSGGGGGGGGSSPTYTSYTGTGTLTVNNVGTVLRSIKVNADDKVGSLLVPIGVKALDKDGKPLTSITLTPLASDKMPAVPSGALFKFAGYVYEAGPDGATFEPGITLAFDLPADAWNALDPDNNDFKVKWYNEETEEWEDVPTTTYKSTRSVDAEITHFSIFALFTEPVTTPTETPTPPVDIDIPTTPPVDEKPPAGEFPTTIFAIVVVLVIVIAAGYFFIVRK